jgi:hypothetical protein
MNREGRRKWTVNYQFPTQNKPKGGGKERVINKSIPTQNKPKGGGRDRPKI